MRKFEYRLLDTTSGFFSGIDYQELMNRLNQLNQLGSQDWEVVSVLDTIFTHNQARDLLITLKRELPG